MAKQIIVAVDGLSGEGQQKIRDVAANAGATVSFLPESEAWKGGLDGVDAAFGLPPASLVESSSLRFLQLHSSGFDPYRTPGIAGKIGLQIANARGVTAQAVAEQCLSMMFALARRVPFQMRHQSQHIWQRASSYELLFGSTVGIVGLGAIGSAVGKMCKGIGMRVLSVQRSREKQDFVDEIYPMDRLQSALTRCHHLVLALPSIPLTKPLIGGEELAAMPRGSYVYSMSRATLLDYDAMIEALDTGQLAGAGLDVFPQEPLPSSSPLWDREDVLIAPHSGGRFKGEMDALATLFAENLERHLSGQPLHNVVIPE